MNDNELEILHFLETGKTTRRIITVPPSTRGIVEVPIEQSFAFYAPGAPFPNHPNLPTETVYLRRLEHISGESVWAGIGKRTDTLVVTSNVEALQTG